MPLTPGSAPRRRREPEQPAHRMPLPVLANSGHRTRGVLRTEKESSEGFGEQSVAAVVAGSEPGSTLYHYQIIAKNGKGEVAPIVEQTVIPRGTPRVAPDAPEPTTDGPYATSATLHGGPEPANKHEVRSRAATNLSTGGHLRANAGHEIPGTSACRKMKRDAPSIGERAPGRKGSRRSGRAVAGRHIHVLFARPDQAEEPVLGPPVTFTTPSLAPRSAKSPSLTPGPPVRHCTRRSTRVVPRPPTSSNTARVPLMAR